jgi:hemerythrin-like metal-binding protein
VGWKNVRALVAEDDRETAEIFKEIALQLGIVCDVAASGGEAEALMERNGGYGIYFVDWNISGMSGAELAKRIKSRDEGKAIVAIVSPALWNIAEREARSAGTLAYIAKPLFPSSLAETLDECLGENDAVSPEGDAEDLAGSFEGRSLLLAEDLDINREIVISLLEPTRIAVDCAENGARAVEMFEASPEKYDIILMDVQMPEMDGYEATRRIRALGSPKAESIPIIAMTANVFREDVEKCIASGMNDHLGKPLDFGDALEKLRRYLSGGGSKNALPETRSSNVAGDGDANAWKNGVAWSKDLETGNDEIDSQHKQLFQLVSDLAEACANNGGAETLGESLDFLASYTVNHFMDEEALQLRYGYSGYEEHKKLHDEFRKTASELVALYKANGSAKELSGKVNSVIIRWLAQHIKREDSKIAAHIKKQGETTFA